MARTTSEIYEAMVAEKNRRQELAVLDSQSATAIWRLILYVVAYCIGVLERMWDAYRVDVDMRIDTIMPHRPKWYADKVKSFMADTALMPDTDRYDTVGMTDDEIAAARVVKHAAVTESTTTSTLLIKVAGEEDGHRTPLPDDVRIQLDAYIREIKDAGVVYILVNQPGDKYNCNVDVYYDPMLFESEVHDNCVEAIARYIENLPFNGEYTNMALVDALQQVAGVKIVELKSASASTVDGSTVNIDARAVPVAGYYRADSIDINMIPYA